jgi:hypothetical protein
MQFPTRHSAPLCDGKPLLRHFIELMGSGNRRIALAYRDSLSAQQLEAFYLCLKSPWIDEGATAPRMSQWVISIMMQERANTVELVRDVKSIAAVHGCSSAVEFDTRGQLVKLVLFDSTEALRKVLLDWVRGFAHVTSIETYRASRAMSPLDLRQSPSCSASIG